MHNEDYGLGIDLRDGTVRAALCRVSDGTSEGASIITLGDDPDALDRRTVERVMARVGAPTPLYLENEPVGAADAAAGIAMLTCRLTAAAVGSLPSSVVLTVPPSWGAHRRAALTAALEAAGAPPFSLVSSAVAVTHHHLGAGDLRAKATVAVYDLGASTVDSAVVAPTPDHGPDHPAVPPAPLAWGERDIDDLFFGHVRRCQGEPRASIEPVETQLQLRRLRRACAAARQELSSTSAVQVDVALSGTPAGVRVTREELDELLADPVEASIEAVRGTVSAAGLGPDDLDAVLLAGGGARIPLVAERLAATLGRPVVVGTDPAATAALGAARLAAEELLAADAVPASAPAEAPVPEEPTGWRSHLVPPSRRPRRSGTSARPSRSPGHPGRRLVSRVPAVLALLLALLLLPPVLLTARGHDSTGSSVTGRPATSTSIGPSARGAEEWADPTPAGRTP